MATFPSPTLQNLTVEGAATVTDTIAASNFSGSSSGTNTGDQTITLTGDVTGSGTGSFTTALAAVGVAGTYGSAAQVPVFTTDAKGRVIDVTLAAISGGVSSVGLVDSTGLFTITGSPVTSTGNLTLSAFASKAANVVFAGPNGAAGAPSFRALVAADIPSLSASYLSAGGGTVSGQTTIQTSSLINSLVISDQGINGSNLQLIGNGTSAPNKYLRSRDGLFDILNSGYSATIFSLDDSGNIADVNNITATGALKGSNFNTGLAPSSLTAGASPWTWQNTNAYGVFFCIFGGLGISGAVKLSANNSTYFTVAETSCQIYVQPGFYIQVVYSTTPPGVTIVPI